MLVDSHCHLDYLARDGDLDDVVARARAAGVDTMITICTKLSEFDGVRAIAERYDGIYCSVGVHPHEADEEGQADTERLGARANHPKVVGIGETGLDYYYEHASRDWQRRSFRAHIAAEQGHINAMNDLGYMYRQGWGVTQNYSDALQWFRKAAEKYDSYAEYNLGQMYEHGWGTEKNQDEAVRWFRRSAARGHEWAAKRLEELGVTT